MNVGPTPTVRTFCKAFDRKAMMANHPIFYPTFHGHVEAVRELLSADRDLVKVRDAKNLTPLHVAASRGQHEVARLLLEQGADVQGPSEEDQWTPLVFAAYRGHLDVVQVLLDNGAQPTEAHGNPIHYAGQRKHKEICRVLVAHGAVDDLPESKEPDVIELFRAAYSYDSTTVDAILSRRPELVHSKDRHGRTPLHEACTNGDTGTVRVLLRHGADANHRDDRGERPLDRASAHRQQGVVKILEKHGL